MSEGTLETRRARELCLAMLRDPAATVAWPEQDWDLLLRVARRARLLGWLATRLHEEDLLPQVPPIAAGLLTSALAELHKMQQMGSWEVDRISWALRDSDVPIVLLKGMAYLMAGLPPARGRTFSDVDVMVPGNRVEEVEKILVEKGWVSRKLDPYDQLYYRRWMHELPPLRHRERATEVDLHHAILPRTSRANSDPDKLFAAAVRVDGKLRVLAPADMVVHSAVHLFHDGEMANALRDLLDIEALLRHYGENARFWDDLVPRAVELGLARPLFYALRYAKRLLGTPVPDSAVAASACESPGRVVLFLMDFLVPQALLPTHPDFPLRRIGLARWLLYVRSHYLRMPLHLLIPHLLRKALVKQPSIVET